MSNRYTSEDMSARREGRCAWWEVGIRATSKQEAIEAKVKDEEAAATASDAPA
jgi:hypothetical protein